MGSRWYSWEGNLSMITIRKKLTSHNHDFTLLTIILQQWFPLQFALVCGAGQGFLFRFFPCHNWKLRGASGKGTIPWFVSREQKTFWKWNTVGKFNQTKCCQEGWRHIDSASGIINKKLFLRDEIYSDKQHKLLEHQEMGYMSLISWTTPHLLC